MSTSPGAPIPDHPLAQLAARAAPDERGRYGRFGGRFVPELLMPTVQRLEAAAREAFADAAFWAEFDELCRDWIGRPTPLCRVPRLSAEYGADIWLKREDLAHTGAHKINNAIGQALLARRLGAQRIVAETGAGQHGVATAAACARMGLEAVVYMGAVDVARQAPNVERMVRFGAEVRPVTSGDRTLRSAIDEAMRDWVADPAGTHYLIGSAVGPHPFPWIVRTFQAVIGVEARAQVMAQHGGLPDDVVACVGGGSNAIGLFAGFLDDAGVAIHGAEAGGTGEAHHAATISRNRGAAPGVLHGAMSLLMQDADGQVREAHSVSAGLDYPGVGPEHAQLGETGRVRYHAVSDADALGALADLCRLEGLLPAIESAHALALAKRLAAEGPGRTILVGLSGRGDKDMPILAEHAPVDGDGGS